MRWTTNAPKHNIPFLYFHLFIHASNEIQTEPLVGLHHRKTQVMKHHLDLHNNNIEDNIISRENTFHSNHQTLFSPT